MSMLSFRILGRCHHALEIWRRNALIERKAGSLSADIYTRMVHKNDQRQHKSKVFFSARSLIVSFFEAGCAPVCRCESFHWLVVTDFEVVVRKPVRWAYGAPSWVHGYKSHSKQRSELKYRLQSHYSLSSRFSYVRQTYFLSPLKQYSIPLRTVCHPSSKCIRAN